MPILIILAVVIYSFINTATTAGKKDRKARIAKGQSEHIVEAMRLTSLTRTKVAKKCISSGSLYHCSHLRELDKKLNILKNTY